MLFSLQYSTEHPYMKNTTEHILLVSHAKSNLVLHEWYPNYCLNKKDLISCSKCQPRDFSNRFCYTILFFSKPQHTTQSTQPQLSIWLLHLWSYHKYCLWKPNPTQPSWNSLTDTSCMCYWSFHLVFSVIFFCGGARGEGKYPSAGIAKT